MKKIFSIVLVLVMMFSMVTLSASAATNAKFEVSYLDSSSNAITDLTTLKVDDIFYAQVLLKDATAVQTADLTLTWDSSKIYPVDKNGNSSTVITSIASNTAKKSTTTMDEDMNVIIGLSDTTEVKDGELSYTAYTTEGAYSISSNFKYLTVRFKVKALGDTKFTMTAAKINEVTGKDEMDNILSVSTVPALVIGSTTPVTPPATTTEQKAKATAVYKAGMTGIRFNVSNGDETVGYAVKFAENTQLEAASNVSIGLTVTGIPSGKSVTITAEEYYGSQFKVALK